jgi:hypothetical protein
VGDLLTEATNKFTAAEEALKAGDLAGYQRNTNEAKDLVRRASDAARSPASPTTTTTPPTTRPTA